MKKLYLILLLGLITTAALAQHEKMQAIFEVTSSDINVHESAVRHVKGMAEAFPDAEFEMVIYGGALPMLLANRSSVKADIESLAEAGNVSLKVCAIALKKNDLKEQDLIIGVEIVPNGIVEVLDKQKKGWGYIKESN